MQNAVWSCESRFPICKTRTAVQVDSTGLFSGLKYPKSRSSSICWAWRVTEMGKILTKGPQRGDACLNCQRSSGGGNFLAERAWEGPQQTWHRASWWRLPDASLSFYLCKAAVWGLAQWEGAVRHSVDSLPSSTLTGGRRQCPGGQPQVASGSFLVQLQ